MASPVCPNWKVLTQQDVANLGPKQVIVNNGKPYETLLIVSNNANNIAINTVNAFYALAQYYQQQGVSTLVYGMSASSGHTNGSTLTALGWNANQCNPLVAWIRQGQIDPVYQSRAKGFTSAELDTLIRNNVHHDPALDLIPAMGSASTASAMSKFEAIPASMSTYYQDHRTLVCITLVVVGMIVFHHFQQRKLLRRFA